MRDPPPPHGARILTQQHHRFCFLLFLFSGKHEEMRGKKAMFVEGCHTDARALSRAPTSNCQHSSRDVEFCLTDYNTIYC